MSKSIARTRRRWHDMKKRCFCPGWSNRIWQIKGITVCSSWAESFETFLNDMGECPSDKHSLDRIDNDKNYEPDNCRWATRKEQARNMSTNKLIGDKSVAQVAEETGISEHTLRWRLRRGKTGAELLDPKIKGPQRKLTSDQVVEIRCLVYLAGNSYKAIASEYNVSYVTIRSIALGLSHRDI